MNKENQKKEKKSLKGILLFLLAPKNLPLMASLFGGTALLATGTVLLANPGSSNSSAISSETTSTTSNTTSITSSTSVSVSSSTTSVVQFTVTFEANGGTIVADAVVNQNGLIMPPTSTNGIYQLEGWFTSNDNGVTLLDAWDFNSDLVNSDLTLYAKWTSPIQPKSYDLLVSGRRFATYVDETGVVYSWGANRSASVGLGHEIEVPFPSEVDIVGYEVGERIVHLTSGRSHTVALTNQNRLIGWGAGEDGQLGPEYAADVYDDYVYVPSFLNIPGFHEGETITYVDSGYYSTYFLTSEHRVLAMGDNVDGNLGINQLDADLEAAFSPIELEFPLLDDEFIVNIELGEYHGFAMSNQGRVFGWGVHSDGQLGMGDYNAVDATAVEYYISPFVLSLSMLAADEYVSQISADQDMTLMLTNKQRLFAMGSNDGNVIAQNDGIWVPTITEIPVEFLIEDETMIDIEMGQNFITVLTNQNRLFAWGSNSVGQIGQPDEVSDSPAPIEIEVTGLLENETIQSVDLYEETSFFKTSLNNIYGWGKNNDSQVGVTPLFNENDDRVHVYTPTKLTFNRRPVFVAAYGGATHSLALTNTGQMYVWGRGLDGQLGLGETDLYATSPTKLNISGLSANEKVSSVYLKFQNNYAITTEGKLFGWGRNFYGEIGQGHTNNVFIPTLISLPNLLVNEKPIEVVSNGFATLVLTNEGRLFGMGNSGSYLIGGDSITDILSPTLYTNLTLNAGEKVTQIELGNNHAFALTSANRLFSWGFNFAGQLGNGVFDTDAPIQMPVLVNTSFLQVGETISKVSLGSAVSFIITSLGRVFGWGSIYAHVGVGFVTNLNPLLIEVPGLTEGEIVRDIKIYFDSYRLFFITSSNRFLYWGENTYSESGLGYTGDVPFIHDIESLTFEKLLLNETVIDVNIGDSFSIFVSSSGRIMMVGEGSDYIFGNFDDGNNNEYRIIIVSAN